jgi:hypothetical protein
VTDFGLLFIAQRASDVRCQAARRNDQVGYAHETRIWGTRNSSSLSPHRGYGGKGHECKVELEKGDEKNGYHLVMSPAGFFTADEWYETRDGALAAAAKLFRVAREQGSAKGKRRTRALEWITCSELFFASTLRLAQSHWLLRRWQW